MPPIAPFLRSSVDHTSALMEDSLYGDLDIPETTVQSQELEVKLATANRRISQLESKAALVGKECVQLRKENVTLRQNASVLYNTAKRELERKDRLISQLRDELMTLKQGGRGR